MGPNSRQVGITKNATLPAITRNGLSEEWREFSDKRVWKPLLNRVLKTLIIFPPISIQLPDLTNGFT